MKSYTLDKLNEARDALNRDDHAACMAALDELIKRMEIMMQPFIPKPHEWTQEYLLEPEKELNDGIDTGATTETP